jgi:hypothetical protein
MEVKIGCDPEVFVQNPNSLQFLCAHNMIPGDKANPHRVPFGAVQVDGMALEFNTDPASTEEEFLHHVKAVYHELERMVPGYKLACVPFAQFEQEYFDNCDPYAKVLGCDPDFNAWTGLKNAPPAPTEPVRTASGHIHIGWTEGADIESASHFADCIEVVKQLDYGLGVNSLLYDTDNRRRSLYGNAGAFRPKPYGVEYRVLSNAWLLDDELIGWVYRATRASVDALEAGNNWTAKYGDRAQRIIGENDIAAAKRTSKVLGIEAPPVLKKAA